MLTKSHDDNDFLDSDQVVVPLSKETLETFNEEQNTERVPFQDENLSDIDEGSEGEWNRGSGSWNAWKLGVAGWIRG